MKYVWHDGEWVRAIRVNRASNFPMIIRDNMEAAMHPATGEMIDSKREFRRITRAHGLIEVGDEAPMNLPTYETEGAEEDVGAALMDLRNGMPFQPAEQADDDTRFYEVK